MSKEQRHSLKSKSPINARGGGLQANSLALSKGPNLFLHALVLASEAHTLCKWDVMALVIYPSCSPPVPRPTTPK